MAQRVHVVLEDDLNGGEASETVRFALDGTTYEIDLNEDNASQLRKALAPFIEAGRKVSRAGTSGRRTGSSNAQPSSGAAKRNDLAAIRQWARANGWPKLSDRGRVPADVVAAYDAAH